MTAAVAALVAGGPHAANAAPPTAIVSMGDSYISGEAGRRQGNSDTALASRDGTDRACVPWVVLCTNVQCRDPSAMELEPSS